TCWDWSCRCASASLSHLACAVGASERWVCPWRLRHLSRSPDDCAGGAGQRGAGSGSHSSRFSPLYLWSSCAPSLPPSATARRRPAGTAPCNNDYVPVCGSNNKNYQNECFLRRDACKQQSEVLIVSEGDCPADAGSGSGDDGGEGSAETGLKETSTCDICQFGAECDVDAEDVWCVCNIDCSHISFNPVCASDGRSYDNPCQVKEASCQKQERIEVKYLGHCHDDIIGNKGGDGHFARTDPTGEKEETRNGLARGLSIPCPDRYKNYCVHGECQFPSVLAQPSCSCHSGFRGPHCDIKEYNVLYVVPGSGKLHYVLIASIIGALQVVIICVVVLCITRKCPRTNRINRQKQNNVHFSSENTMRASTRLI
uniref:Transmembrane protein with EGF-like and two follistatin-like domains 2a n=1 Tax=Astatotilapia calliptera TaxID=8154 RepID=A0A3P8NPH1_ASTCA